VKEMSFKSGVKGRGSDRWWERRWWLWWGDNDICWMRWPGDAYLKERLVIYNEKDNGRARVTDSRRGASSICHTIR